METKRLIFVKMSEKYIDFYLENINNPEIALNNKNLMYVCKDCHDKFDGHFADMRSNSRHTKGLRVCFDEDGYPSPRSDNGHG